MNQDDFIAKLKADMAKKEADMAKKEADMAKKEADMAAEKEKHRKEIEVVDKRAEQYRKEADAAIKVAIKERAEKQVLQNQLNFSRMTSQSYRTCLDEFERNHTKCKSPEEFGLPSLTEQQKEQMVECWNKVKQLQMLGNGSDEKKHVHPYFEDVLSIIIKNSDVKDRLRVHHEVTVSPPPYQWDFAVSASHIERVTYENVECVIELKASVKKKRLLDEDVFAHETALMTDGQGQAISYLTNVCSHIIDSPKNASIARVGIFSNGNVIRFFQFKDNKPGGACASELLSLSSPEPDSPPTEGFRWLFTYLIFMARNYHVDYVTLADNLRHRIVSTFATKDVEVHMVEDGQKRMIVKRYPIPGKHSSNLAMERAAYDYLKKSSKMNLLELHEHLSNDYCLVYSPIGTALPEYLLKAEKNLIGALENAQAEGEPKEAQNEETYSDFVKQKSEIIRRVFFGAIEQLEAMHNSGVCHADIRPMNILVMEDGKVFLIDFETAILDGERLKFDNRSFYSSDRLLLSENPVCYRYMMRDDWYSLAYTFLFTLKQQTFKVNNRAAFVAERTKTLDYLEQSTLDENVLSVLEMLEVIRNTPDDKCVDVEMLKAHFQNNDKEYKLF